MLTINADGHPLMERMHRLHPDRPANMQDKRSVIDIEHGDIEHWLTGTTDHTKALTRLTPAEVFNANPGFEVLAPRY